MKTLELEITDSNEKSKNIALKINGKEAGVLYLTNDEYYDFIKVLRKGTDEEFELIEPIDYDSDDEE
jgi:hypothetical protein